MYIVKRNHTWRRNIASAVSAFISVVCLPAITIPRRLRLAEMESESPLEVLSRAATMLHREETAAAAAAAVVDSSYATSEYL